jgi:hypothetical protein
MADIDLKTETPDASLPATGFLFGADSQAAASPSVYTTQSVATRLLGSTTLSGTTITANAPVLDLAQTWNNAAVTFTGAKFNVTDTASNAASLLMDLQVGGASRFGVRKNGDINSSGSLSLGNNQGIFLQGSASSVNLVSGTNINWNNELYLTRRGAANLRLGAADAAAPVAQTLSVQGVVAGTTNTAGANLTIAGSQGTGTGAGGSIVFQVAPAGSSGTAQNALATAWLMNSAGSFVPGSDNGPSLGSGGSRINSAFIATAIELGTNATIRWSDVTLRRDADNTLALRNGTNAQTFRVYNTTDGTNSEFGGIRWTSNVFEIGAQTAGTGTNRLVRFTSAVSSGSAWEFRNSAAQVPVLVIAGSDRSVSLSPQVNMLVANAGGFASNLDYSSGASSTYAFQAKNGNASIIYFGLIGSAAKVMQLNDGSGRGDGYGAATEMWEMTAPAAPAANGVRIYAVDNGSGKTQLMALFATGAAQQIAIEP